MTHPSYPLRPIARKRFRTAASRSLPARAGVALVMAVVAMAVLGALVAGVFFAAMRDQRDGRDAVSRVGALAGAEYGLELTIAPGRWRSIWNTTARRGLLDSIVYDPGGGSIDTVRLWKLESNVFLLVSSGSAGPPTSRARRRIALLVTPRVPRPAVHAAVTASNGAAVADSSAISGFDSVAADWSCPPPSDALPAVAVPDSALVDDGACTVHPCLIGAQPVSVDSLAGSVATYEHFGGSSRASLAAAAVQLPDDALLVAPGPTLDASGACDSSDPRNLGDPDRLLGATSACADYFPVLHAPGNMRIEGGAGQGFLLVDGDLTIGGGARFRGVVAVRGVLKITEGSELAGLVLASSVIVDVGSSVSYSSCASDRALRAAGVPVVPRGQAWSEMY